MKTIEHKGYTAKIAIHQDEDSGPPWKQDDGHGVISEWTTRDKRAGERVLNSSGNSKQFYDFAASVDLAKRDGWGLSEAHKAELANKLGRQPTRKEIIAAAVESDYKFVRGWCDNEWCYQGYTTEIETPDGETFDGDSCWGYEGTADGEKYMLGEASDAAISAIERHLATVEQTAIAECVP